VGKGTTLGFSEYNPEFVMGEAADRSTALRTTSAGGPPIEMSAATVRYVTRLTHSDSSTTYK